MDAMNIFASEPDERIDYLFMNKDEVVATFTLNRFKNFATIDDVAEIRLPKWINDFASFIEHRSAPRGREHIQELLQLSGCNTLQGFLDVTHALSLTDTFWVKRSSSKLEWQQVSLFDNEFNEVIAHTAFDGGMYSDNLSTPSPEYGTDGSFAKCWIRENGKIRMLKQGSSGARNTGLEPYSEYYASQVAKAFGTQHVDYSLRTHKGRACSICDCFTTEQVGYVPFSAFRCASSLNSIYQYYVNIGLIRDLIEMFVFDALILNEDRHKGNFGFLFNTTTYEILGTAPLFDHNVSLLCYAEKDDFNSDWIKSRMPRIGYDFISDASLLPLPPEMRRRLIRMNGFQFDRGDSKLELPEWRLKKLEAIVNEQIIKLCSLK